MRFAEKSHIAQEAEEEQDIRTSGEVGGVTELIGTSPGFASSSSSSSSRRRGKQHHPPLPAHHPRLCVATARREEGPSASRRGKQTGAVDKNTSISSCEFRFFSHWSQFTRWKWFEGAGFRAAGRLVADVFFGLIAVVVRIGVPLIIGVFQRNSAQVQP